MKDEELRGLNIFANFGSTQKVFSAENPELGVRLVGEWATKKESCFEFKASLEINKKHHCLTSSDFIPFPLN